MIKLKVSTPNILRTYPYIGEYSISSTKKMYVLFFSQKTGTYLGSSDTDWSIGEYHDKWSEIDFIKLDKNTKIELSNE